MYCIKCGVKLADSEKSCPLCGTVVYHPDLKQAEGEAMYPKDKMPVSYKGSKWPLIFLSIAFIIPILVVFLCDLRMGGGVSWSAYVMGAIALGYELLILPMWFEHPSPVIFVPCAFAAVGAYVLLIDLMTGGNWFLSFAFPVLGISGIVSTVVATLLKYLSRGKLFIFGGAFIFLGACMLPMEFLVAYTFSMGGFSGWCFYPMIPLVLLGFFLIFLGICRPAREQMERIFFI